MDTTKRLLFRWLLCSIAGALASGCASSSTTHREDALGDSEAAEHLPDERAYRDAAEKFLKFLEEERQAGPSVIQASGKDGIYPMYECMDYGCPDKVLCKEANVYCHVTHCGKGSCRGCPEPFPDVFKNIFIKEWCKFDCLRGAVWAGTAFGFVPSIGKKLFIGPVACLIE
ncbi:hypothetical protein [Archangium sp.]|uniref:hypothetical protein n=1 Tax=Archangium sp. TaxID=1872627 RepID=UPI002ED9786C